MWRVAGGGATGRSHLKTGLPCQDRFASAVLPNGIYYAAVADGAGSAVMAERGAETAVTTAMNSLGRALGEGRSDHVALLREAASAAREAILSEASQAGADPRDFASTLLLVVASPDGGAALQIGDGVIVVNEGDDEWCWVFWPQHGQYINTTHFLTDDDYADSLQAEPISNKVMDIAVMTDGLEPLAISYSEKAAHRPFFQGMFSPLVASGSDAELEQLKLALKSFLESDVVGSRSDDDVTIVLATRR